MADHVFGPVPSRRLGRSLGVDLVPFKTCTYDCIYCQLGRTTRQSVDRRDWVSPSQVVAELKEKLSYCPDCITLSGSGEPTLCLSIDRVVDAIRRITAIPIAVLTNGSLLWHGDLRRQLCRADVVIPTLTTANDDSFVRIHRPHASIRLSRVLDGLARLRQEFTGRCWLEVFLLDGINDGERELEGIVRWAERIAPARVQLNTVARPPDDPTARSVSPQRLARLARLFSPPAQVIAALPNVHSHSVHRESYDQIRELLKRRPCTVEDLANGLHLHAVEVCKGLESLLNAGEAVQCAGGAGGMSQYFRSSDPTGGK